MENKEEMLVEARRRLDDVLLGIQQEFGLVLNVNSALQEVRPGSGVYMVVTSIDFIPTEG